MPKIKQINYMGNKRLCILDDMSAVLSDRITGEAKIGVNIEPTENGNYEVKQAAPEICEI